MKMLLLQLYHYNESKPIVGIDDYEVQWDKCDLSDCPPYKVPGTVSMTNHGKFSSLPQEELPKSFIDTEGKEHLIADIHSLKASR